MGETGSLLEFVQLLLRDDVERARFAADPDDTLTRFGLGDLSPADVHDAVGFVEDTITVDWARAYAPDPVIEHAEPERPPALPDVDDVLFDGADLHFGH